MKKLMVCPHLHARQDKSGRPARRCRSKGYSLVELLVVIVIILIVMTLILCTLSKVWKAVQGFRA